MPDLTLIQQEVDALEELSRQLFLETADLHATKVQSKGREVCFGQCDGRGNKCPRASQHRDTQLHC